MTAAWRRQAFVDLLTPANAPTSSLPFRRFERHAGAFGVAARFARVRDKAPIVRPQGIVAPSPGVGARGCALGLRVVALLQPHARELLPQARIARLDAKRTLERGCCVREAPGGGIGARPEQEARDGEVLGVGRGRGQLQSRTGLQRRTELRTRTGNLTPTRRRPRRAGRAPPRGAAPRGCRRSPSRRSRAGRRRIPRTRRRAARWWCRSCPRRRSRAAASS